MPEEPPEFVRPKKVSRWQRAFLASLARVGVIGHAAEMAKVDARTVRRTRASDPEFAASMAEAMEEAADRLEREAIRRAHDGVEEPVFGSLGQGEGTGKVGRIQKYSDTLLIFLLKGARPGKYRERVDHAHTGEVTQRIVRVPLKEPAE